MLQGEHTGFLCLERFYLFPKQGIIGEVSGEDLNTIFISFPGKPFQGRGLH